ncbi:MAG: HNH endonuclease, partial [Pelodictyon phaeoclathratiforme]
VGQFLGLSQASLVQHIHKKNMTIVFDRSRRKKKPSLLDQYGPLLKHLSSIGWNCQRIVAALDLPVKNEQVRRWLRDHKSATQAKRGAHYGEWNVSYKDGLSAKRERYNCVCPPQNYQGRKKANGWVFEHRLVMEEMIGRLLLPNEVVHHIDNNGFHNDPSNLMLFPDNKSHLQYHYELLQEARQERLSDLLKLDREYVQSLDWSETDDQQIH